MSAIQEEIVTVFGNRLRTRVSGICVQDDKILLVKHHSLGPYGILWAPPGGGMNYGEKAETSLKREMQEECGLEVTVGPLLFVYEYLDEPLHAIELFFEVKIVSGELIQGFDPELSKENQIIHEVSWVAYNEINQGNKAVFHEILTKVDSVKELLKLRGYFTASNP